MSLLAALINSFTEQSKPLYASAGCISFSASCTEKVSFSAILFRICE